MKLAYRIFFIVNFLLGNLNTCFAELPDDWYKLPEDQLTDNSSFTGQKEGVVKNTRPGKDIDNILDLEIQSNVSVLDKVEAEEQSHINNLTSESLSGTPWHMSHFAFDLGLSAAGGFGILMTSHQSVINLYYRHKTPKGLASLTDSATEENILNNSDSTPSINFTDPLSPKEVSDKAESLVSALMATGKIKDKNNLKKNMLKAVYDFQELALGMNHVNSHRHWAPSRLRLDFAVSAEGMVFPFVMVGAELKVRFDWFPRKVPKTSFKSDETTISQTAKSKKLTDFLENLAKQMFEIKINKAEMPKNFELTQLIFSLGVFADGNFGIAQAGVNAVGFVYFSHQEGLSINSSNKDGNPKNEPIPLIAKDVTIAVEQFAQNHNIEKISDDRSSKKVFLMPALEFTKGMEKAIHMGCYFVDRAKRHESQKWEVDFVRIQYGVSLSGSVILANLGISASIQAVFQQIDV